MSDTRPGEGGKGEEPGRGSPSESHRQLGRKVTADGVGGTQRAGAAGQRAPALAGPEV